MDNEETSEIENKEIGKARDDKNDASDGGGGGGGNNNGVVIVVEDGGRGGMIGLTKRFEKLKSPTQKTLRTRREDDVSTSMQTVGSVDAEGLDLAQNDDLWNTLSKLPGFDNTFREKFAEYARNGNILPRREKHNKKKYTADQDLMIMSAIYSAPSNEKLKGYKFYENLKKTPLFNDDGDKNWSDIKYRGQALCRESNRATAFFAFYRYDVTKLNGIDEEKETPGQTRFEMWHNNSVKCFEKTMTVIANRALPISDKSRPTQTHTHEPGYSGPKIDCSQFRMKRYVGSRFKNSTAPPDFVDQSLFRATKNTNQSSSGSSDPSEESSSDSITDATGQKRRRKNDKRDEEETPVKQKKSM